MNLSNGYIVTFMFSTLHSFDIGLCVYNVVVKIDVDIRHIARVLRITIQYEQAVRLGGRHNMPPPLLTVGQRVCKCKGVSKEILRVF